ncbi:cellulose biosynthesis protein BcsG [Paraferrimonas sp. SM1919]|uniref:cellulose biosynthesis protein BcsG n=1 Tax=Paraferrimonas sp. SM1919 TaxID=2662263 RepID=UPI0013D0E26F|nr:cellulose biosynthesis protein BcsG [Paraferrimonas sp. SM1919]
MIEQPSLQKNSTINQIGFWFLYFTLKFSLYFNGNINFHLWENLAFFLFLILPIGSNLLCHLRNILAVPLGVALFYYDSWLPSFTRVSKQFYDLSQFSFDYFVELFSRVIDWQTVAIGFIAWVVYVNIKQIIRLNSVIVVGFIVIMIHRANTTETTAENQTLPQSNDSAVLQDNAILANSPSQMLHWFYQNEQQKRIDYSGVTVQTEFDILIINVCSLAWQDLKFTGLDSHPLMSEFDIIFNNFNSVSPYSGPASIRLMKANCGQTAEAGIYEHSSNDCYLSESLKSLGFEAQTLFNHDAQFGNFAKEIDQYGRWNGKRIDNQQAKVNQLSFDGSNIYSDASVLQQWFNLPQNRPTVTYYNSISLHDGNKLIGNQQNLNSLESFHPRLSQFLNDIYGLFNTLQNSDRKTMVIFVPEHGAGLKGDKLQIAGMREFPSPNLTLVPAAVKFFGLQQPPQRTQVINQTMSYYALAQIIHSAITKDIFGNQDVTISQLLANIEATTHVAENNGATVVKFAEQYLLRVDPSEQQWIPY